MHRLAGRPVAATVVALLAVLGVLAPALAGPRPAGGAPTTTTTAPPAKSGTRIELAAQDPWTPVGGDVTLRLLLAGVGADAVVSLSAHQAVSTRKGFEATMAGGSLGSVLSQVSVPVSALGTAADGSRIVQVGLQGPNDARDPARLNVRRPGVYPLVVEARDADDRVLAGFRTALVVSESEGRATVAVPLGVAWVWPLTAAPARLPDDEPDRAVVAALRSDGRLGRQAGALREIGDVPVTLAPGPETLAAWSEFGREDATIAIGADTVRAISPVREIITSTYEPVDLPSLVDHGLVNAVDEQILRGFEGLRGVYGNAFDPKTTVVRPASTSALARLHASGADRFVVDADALAPTTEPRLTPALPITLRVPATNGTEPVQALVTEPTIQAFLLAEQPAALRAQLLLADLAVVALEAPSVSRVVTIVTPADLDAPVGLYTALLSGLRQNPYLEPITLSAAFARTGTDAATERSLADPTTAEPPVGAAAYRDRRAQVNAFGSMAPSGLPLVAAADRALVASVSDARPDSRADGAAYLRSVDATISGYLDLIEVPNPGKITITSRSGEIPLTFRNGTGTPVRVRVALTSDRLLFPAGSVLDLELPPRSTTVRVAVEARTSGTFPIDLRVTSPDGVLTVSQRRLEVRSTFFSRVGLFATAAAAVVLAGWWGWDFRRRRRRRSTGATPEATS